MIPGRTYTPQDVIEALWRRWPWMAGAFVVLSAAALAAVLSFARSYTSVATIQIVSEPVADGYVKTTPQTRLSDRLPSIGQATLTRSRLETIIKDLDLYPDMRQRAVMEQVVERMRSDITFRSTDRDVFNLGFTSQSPRVAHAVATRLTALFLEENARDREQQAEATTHFLDSQLADIRKTLDTQEAQLETYKAQHSGELPTQLSLNVQELNNSQNNLRSLLETIARDQDQKLFMQRQLEVAQSSADVAIAAAGTGGVTFGGDPASGQGQPDPLEAARATLKSLELRLTPEHPDVQRTKRLIATLEQQKARERTASGRVEETNPASLRRDYQLRELRGQIDTLDRRLAANSEQVRHLRARIDQYSRRIDATPLRESELATLSRDYEDTKKLYSSLLARKQEASMAANLERKNIGDRFRVIEPAQLPQRASSKSRRSQLLLGLMVALGVSVALGAFIEYRDTSVRTETDVAAVLHLPVLAVIPDLRSPAIRRSR
ncbi:MAG: hypothetical protein AB1806_16180 [Acidobacteriota bacterium]